MSTVYTNDLRLKEIGTGLESGTWGTSTNTNLSLIAEAFSYQTEATFGSDANVTTTIADGATDKYRAMYVKVTSTTNLTGTRTLEIGPNTCSKIIFIENATSGSQAITIKQGSGATQTIANGKSKLLFLEGTGASAGVIDALDKIEIGSSATIGGVTPISADSTTTFTNKTFDADATGNSLTNVEDANIKASAAIDATKIANGTISNTEFQYLNGVTSAIQTQLNAKGTSSFSGSYNDLSNKPTIPTNNNQLTNGEGYLKASSYSNSSTSGYIRFSNGFQMCWAKVYHSYYGTTWTYPLSFPNAVVSASKHDIRNSSSGHGSNYVYDITTSNLKYTGSVPSGYALLIAIGY